MGFALETLQTDPLCSNSRYRKVAELCRKCDTFVYQVHDLFQGKDVALKFFKRGSTFNPARVLREILDHRALDHPHIIQYEEVFLTPEFLAVAMELAPDGTLTKRMQRQLSEQQTRWLFQQIMLALDFCDKKGIVVRAVHPDNMLLDNSRYQCPILKICQLDSLKDHLNLANDPGLSCFQPPEARLLLGKKSNGQAANVWSAGMILYGMLYGRTPFSPEGVLSACQGGLLHAEVTLQVMDPKFQLYFPTDRVVSEQCKGLVRRMLDPNPLTRASMKDILSDPWFAFGLPPNCILTREEVKAMNVPSMRQTAGELSDLAGRAVYVEESNQAPSAQDDYDSNPFGLEFDPSSCHTATESPVSVLLQDSVLSPHAVPWASSAPMETSGMHYMSAQPAASSAQPGGILDLVWMLPGNTANQSAVMQQHLVGQELAVQQQLVVEQHTTAFQQQSVMQHAGRAQNLQQQQHEPMTCYSTATQQQVAAHHPNGLQQQSLAHHYSMLQQHQSMPQHQVRFQQQQQQSAPHHELLLQQQQQPMAHLGALQQHQQPVMAQHRRVALNAAPSQQRITTQYEEALQRQASLQSAGVLQAHEMVAQAAAGSAQQQPTAQRPARLQQHGTLLNSVAQVPDGTAQQQAVVLDSCTPSLNTMDFQELMQLSMPQISSNLVSVSMAMPSAELPFDSLDIDFGLPAVALCAPRASADVGQGRAARSASGYSPSATHSPVAVQASAPAPGHSFGTLGQLAPQVLAISPGPGLAPTAGASRLPPALLGPKACSSPAAAFPVGSAPPLATQASCSGGSPFSSQSHVATASPPAAQPPPCLSHAPSAKRSRQRPPSRAKGKGAVAASNAAAPASLTAQPCIPLEPQLPLASPPDPMQPAGGTSSPAAVVLQPLPAIEPVVGSSIPAPPAALGPLAPQAALLTYTKHLQPGMTKLATRPKPLFPHSSNPVLPGGPLDQLQAFVSDIIQRHGTSPSREAQEELASLARTLLHDSVWHRWRPLLLELLQYHAWQPPVAAFSHCVDMKRLSADLQRCQMIVAAAAMVPSAAAPPALAPQHEPCASASLKRPPAPRPTSAPRPSKALRFAGQAAAPAPAAANV